VAVDTPPLTQSAFIQLARRASLAGRPGIVLVDDDLSAVDELIGSRARSHDLLKDLERQGRLRAVRRGVYVLVSLTGTVEAGLFDLIAAVTPEPYLVTAGRALQFHELTDQHFRRIVVAVPRQLRPWTWRGDEVRYARTARRRLRSTRTRRAPAHVASPQRAIVDSLAHPQWGVTLSQVVEATDAVLAREPDLADALAIEAADSENHALARRLGFIVSRLAGPEQARPFRPLRGDSNAVTPLQRGGPSTGPIDQTWRVRENVSFDRLLAHREIM
jgi:predicted transcriptional regulator of viral defense system